jgi:FAD/FMN-containing dehydrogenase
MPAGASQLFMVSWGGAVARRNDTPLSARNARFVVHPFGMWQDPADDAANIAWARAFRDDLAEFSTGAVYLNFIGDEGEARLRAGYGPGSYERLAQVKAEWDPGNLFRAGGNVPPAPLAKAA